MTDVVAPEAHDLRSQGDRGGARAGQSSAGLTPASAAADRLLARLGTASWRLVGIALAVYVLLWVYKRVELIVLAVVVALLLAAVISIPVGWLERVGLPRGLATAFVLVVMLGGAGGAAWWVAPDVMAQFRQTGAALQESAEVIRGWLVTGPAGLTEEQVDTGIERAQDRLRERGPGFAMQAIAGLSLLASMIAGALTALVLSFFFVKDGARMVDASLGLLSREAAAEVRGALDRAWSVLRRYIVGSTADGVIEGVLVAVALLLLGVPLVVPLAILTFFGGFLPVAGPIIAGAVASLVALATEGPQTALLVVVVYTAIQQLEGNLLQPLIMGKALSAHPVVILLAVTTGGILAGIAGAFLAVPLVAVIAAVGAYYRERQHDECIRAALDDATQGAARASVGREA
jgi:putative heme transporter